MKRKVLYTHKKLLRTVLLILCLGDFCLNLRHTPIAQVQLSNWNIAYTFEQLAKIKLDNNYKAYKFSGYPDFLLIPGLRFP